MRAPANQSLLFHVHPWHARRESAENFIYDGSGEARLVVGSDGAVRAAADEQDFIADGGPGMSVTSIMVRSMLTLPAMGA